MEKTILEERKKTIYQFICDEFYVPMKAKEMAVVLSVPKSQRSELQEVLDALVMDGRIEVTSKGKYIKSEGKYLIGTFTAHARGFGFVSIEGEEEDIFIPESQVHGAFHMDTVQVAVTSENSGKRREGTITKIISRGTTRIVCTYEKSKTFGFAVPDNPKFGSDIFIPQERSKGAVSGHKVVVEITDYGKEGRKPEGKVVEIIGHINDPGTDIMSIVKAYDLPVEFSEKIMHQVENVSNEVTKYKKSRYKDGFDYIDFDNLKDYANYKVKVLNDRYKALDAKDTNDFIDRLHGNNSGGYNYSADKDSYRRNLNGTLSLNKYLKRGGIIKYQNPSSGIQRKDAIKDYRPQIQESIKQQYTPTYSEISQDNRSEWEKSQSREKADKAYKDYMQAKNTEEGLHNLNGFLTFTDYVGLGTGVGSIVGRGLKYAGKQAIKRATKNKMLKELGEDYTNRLIRALGDKKQPTPISSVKFGNMTSRFAEYLKQQGVDISQFTDRDLLNLMSLRNESVNGNLPELGRFTLVSESKNGGVPIYQSELYSGKDNIIGNLSGTITSKDLKVNSVSKTNPKINAERGVSEDLYNSAIQYAKQQGYGGVRTGDLLQSPEITYKVWDKFSNKELIGTFGEHSFNFGETIKNPELRSKTILDGNVYRLTTPTRFVPTKNQFMFHPSIVDSKTGKLNPPDWNNKDIYKTILPIGVGINNTSYEKEK